MDNTSVVQASAKPNSGPPLHPRTVGWFGTTAVAMGGINQSLFLLSAVMIGQGAIPGQGSAAIVLLGVGLILSWMATPGWTELILMYPNRVGGIAATCAEAFRPYSPVLANLTGVCYWWGWVPTCGLTALLASSAINQWYLPSIPVAVLATCIVLFFTVVNLCGVKWVMRLAMPIASASALLAFTSALTPIFSGSVDWQRAFTFHLSVPFPGWFGELTSVMAGLYLIGFAAPAFEQAACHVGETINPNKNVPRAMLVSAVLASLYFIVLPVVWLGTLGPESLAKELALELGPTFAPLLGGAAKATAIWFMVFNMLHGTIAPLAGAARTLAQLSEDGLLPKSLSKRASTDAPWIATVFTAIMSIIFLLIGDPIWLIAAANLTYLIGIAMPSVAVWLLRKNEPNLPRPYRAPRGTIVLGLCAAGVWLMTVVLGFQQFGLRTVLIGIIFAYSGSVLYAWRKFSDRREMGLPGIAKTLHLKLTGAMLLVLAFDATGYLIAVDHVTSNDPALIAMLEDIFVAVALLTIGVGLVLPGMIAHSAVQVSEAAEQLVTGTLADFTRAMRALAAGDLDSAKARLEFKRVTVYSHDEVGDMALKFNKLQDEIGRAAGALGDAREGLVQSRNAITETNRNLSHALSTADAAIKELEYQKFALDEHAIVGVTDVQGRITYANDRFCQISKFRREELLGQDHRIINSNFHPKEFFHELWRDISSGKVWHGEIKNRAKDGTFYWVNTTIVPFLDQTGKPAQYVAIRTDITDRKQAEQTLIAASRAKSEFLASMSHELRTPLNAILGFSQLFRMTPSLPDEAKDQALEIEQAGRHLLSLVNDVIDLARIESGKLDFSLEPVLVQTALADSLSMVNTLAEKHEIKIRRQFGDGVDLVIGNDPSATVRADAVRLRQVVINLLSNAIKYNRPNGSVTLTFEASKSKVRISVIDTGMGIPESKQKHLFSAFDRLGREAGPIEGTGIGLLISKQLVEAMGGLIDFKSVEGEGSTFWLEFPRVEPIELPAAVRLKQRSSQRQVDRRLVVYVEDNSMNVRLVQQIFDHRKDLELRHTESAEMGIELARALQPELILMDINLRGMDGYAALKLLKADPKTTHIPVVAITANAMKGDEIRGLSTGFADYLTKPIEVKNFLKTIDHYLRIDHGRQT